MRPVTLAAIVTALTLGAGAYALRVGATREPHEVAEPAQPPAPPEALADWCTTGYESIPGGCLAAPASRSAARTPLLIYLHGRYAKDQTAEEIDRQRRVAARFTSKGYAVLALRGVLGGCGAVELASWYCWPSNERTVGTAGDVVRAWQGALSETESRVHPAHRFVLGFSNGGYFAGLIASRGLVQADAYVIAHGGPVDPVEPAREMPPLLLLSADDDVAQDDMLRLDGLLAKARWAHDSYARAGAHGLTDQDIDAALAFFARAKEPLPLNPPLAGLHRPMHHSHDAGAPGDASDDEDASAAPSEEQAAAPSEEQAAALPEEKTLPAEPAPTE